MTEMLFFVALLLVNFLVAPVPTAACPDAPLLRLAVGDSGEVVPGIHQLHLRALPAVGTGDVRRLVAGTKFEVIAGPSCNGGYTWWRVELIDGATGWVAEGTWAAYYLRPLIDDERIQSATGPTRPGYICWQCLPADYWLDDRNRKSQYPCVYLRSSVFSRYMGTSKSINSAQPCAPISLRCSSVSSR